MKSRTFLGFVIIIILLYGGFMVYIQYVDAKIKKGMTGFSENIDIVEEKSEHEKEKRAPVLSLRKILSDTNKRGTIIGKEDLYDEQGNLRGVFESSMIAYIFGDGDKELRMEILNAMQAGKPLPEGKTVLDIEKSGIDPFEYLGIPQH